MKYNKQLFDHIEAQYNQIFNLSEFIYDQLIEKTVEIEGKTNTEKTESRIKLY